jgi:drug resistance transporter, EmrB/QacA subfamily
MTKDTRKENHQTKWEIRILLLTAFFAMLNETSINIALSRFSEIFNVSLSTVQWLTTGFMLVMTVVLPVTAYIIQRYTTRQIYFAALSLIVVGAVAAGAAPVFMILLAGRLVQAAGTCILMALLNNTVLVLTPPHERGAAMGLVSLVAMFAPAIAPTLSGLVIQSVSWRWIFWGLMPLFILMAAFAYVNLKNVSETSWGRLDWLSLILSVAAFGGILYGITSVGEIGSGFNQVVVPLAIGAEGLLLFVRRQLRIEKPLLDMRAFTYPMFTLGMLMIIFSVMTVFAVMVLSPMYLERALGLPTFITGLIILPGGLLNGLAAPVVGRIYDRVGPKLVVIPGVVLMTAIAWVFSTISTSTGIGLFIALHCCILISIAMIMIPAQTNGLNHLPVHLYPHGTAIMTTLMQLAGGLGTATYVSIMSINQQHYLQYANPATANLQQNALVYGFNHAFQFGGLLLIAALVLALFIRSPFSITDGSPANDPVQNTAEGENAV